MTHCARNAAYVGTHFGALLGIQPLLGRTFQPDDGQPGSERVALTSYGLWKSQFGAAQSVIGETIRLNEAIYTVIGVMPRGFFFPDQDVQLWLALPRGLEGLSVRGYPLVHAIARLIEEVTLQQARSEMDTIGRRLEATYPGTDKVSALVLLSGVAACYIPARRAMRTSPVDALRME